MADQKTVEKVKELLKGHCYAPLRDAAEKWLAVADEKYGDKIDEFKEKAAPAMEKLNDAAEKYSDFAIDANEKLKDVSEKVAEGADKLADKAGPAFDEFKEKAAPVIEDLKGKAAPVIDDLKEKATPVIDDLKEKAAPTVDQIKEKAAPAVDSIKAKAAESELIAQLKEGISTLTDVIETFSKPEMKKNVGEEAAEQIRKHAEALKAEGKTYCDCPACTKAREILKDLDIEL